MRPGIAAQLLVLDACVDDPPAPQLPEVDDQMPLIDQKIGSRRIGFR